MTASSPGRLGPCPRCRTGDETDPQRGRGWGTPPVSAPAAAPTASGSGTWPVFIDPRSETKLASLASRSRADLGRPHPSVGRSEPAWLHAAFDAALATASGSAARRPRRKGATVLSVRPCGCSLSGFAVRPRRGTELTVFTSPVGVRGDQFLAPCVPRHAYITTRCRGIKRATKSLRGDLCHGVAVAPKGSILSGNKNVFAQGFQLS